MKKYITNFVKRKKRVIGLTAKILTLGNLKRVISILLLLSMLITSNAISTLASSRPQKVGSSDSANETETTTNTDNDNTTNEAGEFYAEREVDNDLNGIDDDIKIDDKIDVENKIGNENENDGDINDIDNEKIDTENTDSDNDIIPTDDENKIDNEYEEEKEEDEEEGSQSFAPTQEEGTESFAPAEEEGSQASPLQDQINPTSEDGEEFTPQQGEDTNTSEQNTDNANPEETAETVEDKKIDEHITEYIDLFIKNTKSGQTDNKWKIVKVLMQAEENDSKEIHVDGREEQIIKDNLMAEEVMLSPIVSVVIADEYGSKKVVVVPAYWEKTFDEKELINTAKDSGVATSDIGYRLSKEKLIEEVETAITKGVEDLENYDEKMELSPIYIPEDIRTDVLAAIYDRSYAELRLEGIIKEEEVDTAEVDYEEIENDELIENENSEYNEEYDNEIEKYEKQKRYGNDQTDDEVYDNGNSDADDELYNDDEIDNSEEEESYDINNYIKDEELLEKVVENYKKKIREDILGEAVEETVGLIKKSKRYGSVEETNDTTDNFLLPTVNKKMKYGAKHSHNDVLGCNKIGLTGGNFYQIGGSNTFNKFMTISSLVNFKGNKQINLYLAGDFDWGLFNDGKMAKTGKISSVHICLNGYSIKNFIVGNPDSYFKIGIYNCQMTGGDIKSKALYPGFFNNALAVSIIANGKQGFNRGPVNFINTGITQDFITTNFDDCQKLDKKAFTAVFELRGLKIPGIIKIFLKNINTKRNTDKYLYTTSGLKEDPVCYISDCTIDYKNFRQINSYKTIFDISGFDVVKLTGNNKFENFDYNASYDAKADILDFYPLVAFSEVDSLTIDGKLSFTRCSRGMRIFYGYNHTAKNGFRTVVKGEIIYERCMQSWLSQSIGGMMNMETFYMQLYSQSLLQVFYQIYQKGKGHSLAEQDGYFKVENGGSITVKNCDLMGPAIEIKHYNEANFDFIVDAGGKILIEGNNYAYNSEFYWYKNFFITPVKDTTLPLGIRYVTSRKGKYCKLHGSVIIRNNVLRYIKDVFKDKNSFKKYIQTTDNLKTIRPTSMETICELVELGSFDSDVDSQIVLESPRFPDEYLKAAGIDNDRDYFAGLVVMSDFKEVREYVKLGKIRVTDGGIDDPDSSFMSIIRKEWDGNKFKYRFGKDEDKHIVEVLPIKDNFPKYWETAVETSRNNDFIYPQNKFFPIVQPKENYKNHNPYLDFRFKSDGESFYKNYLVYDRSGSNGAYVIQYEFTQPKDYEWSSTFGNGKGTSRVQYALVGKSVTLLGETWKASECKQAGWTLTKDSKFADFSLGQTLSKGITNAGKGKTITLYPVWDIRDAHKHSLCGCDTNSCKHKTDIKTEFSANGIDVTKEVKFKAIDSVALLENSGNFVLWNNITGTKKITVDSGKTLSICLNGFKLEGVYFEGSGTVNITNCEKDKTASIVAEKNNLFAKDLTVNIIQGFNHNKKIDVKNESISFGKKGLVYGANIIPVKDSVKSGSVLPAKANISNWVIAYSDISGYNSGGKATVYPFYNTKFIGDINIKGENLNYPLIELNSGVKLFKANVSIKNSKVSYASIMTINQVSGSNKITLESSKLTITGNEITAKDADLSIVNFGGSENEVLDISNDVTFTVSGNKVLQNNHKKIYAAVRFKNNQKIKAQNSCIVVKDNVGHTNKTDSLYQVYSENSDYIIELPSTDKELTGKFSKDSYMTVEFSEEYGEGTVIKNWSSYTAENSAKYQDIIKADNKKYSDLQVNYDSDKKEVKIVQKHKHSLCGETDNCNEICGELGLSHNERYIFHKVESVEKINELKATKNAFELTKDIGVSGAGSETYIEGTGTIAICLSNHTLTNVVFSGYNEVYITNCKLANFNAGSVGIMDNVKFPDNAFIGIGGSNEINIKNNNEGIINTTKNAYLKNIKIVSGENTTYNNIVTAVNDLLLVGTIDISNINVSDRLFGRVSKLVIKKADVLINKISFSNDRGIIEVGNEIAELEIKNNSKLRFTENEIEKGVSVQAAIKINENKNILVKESEVEIKNTKFTNCVDGYGQDKRVGLINGIHVEKDALIKLQDNASIVVEGMSADGGNSVMAVSPVAVYSLNSDGFVEFKGDISDKTRMEIMFSGSVGTGIITKGFDKAESLAKTIFTADKKNNEEFEIILRSNKNVAIGIAGAGYYIVYNGGNPVGNDINVQYDVEGGSVSHKVLAKLGSNSEKIVYENTNWFSVPGFIFEGWSPYITGVGPDGKRDVVKGGQERDNFNIEEGEEQVVYAIWKQGTYTVRYKTSTVNINGVSVAPSGSNYEEKAYCREPLTIFDNQTANGERFTAKGLKANGFKRGDKEYAFGEVVESMGNNGETIEFNPTWEQKKYRVVFSSGDLLNAPLKEGKSYANGEYGYYDKINIEVPFDFDNIQKEFEGWEITRIDDASDIPIESSSIGKMIGANTKTISQLVDIDNSSIYISAKWKNPSYEIVYRAGVAIDKYGTEHKISNTSGSGTNPTSQAKVEETAKLLSISSAPFKSTGFVLVGWSEDEKPNDYSTIYKTSEVNALSNKKNDVVNLYGVWKEIEYTIQYYLNDGTSVLSQETTSYFDESNLKATVGDSYITNSTIGRGWKLKKVEWVENGQDKSQSYSSPKILRGTTAKKYGLTDKDNAVVSLYVNWVSKSEVHNHKACAISENETCTHLGDSHYNNLIYESFVNIDTVEELLSSFDETSIVMEDNYSENSIREIEVRQGKILNICLNGNKIQNLKFTGTGIINISNCNKNSSTITINEKDSIMFEGCSVGIYGKNNNLVITSEIKSGNIQFIFFQTMYTVIYNAKIQGIRALGIGDFTSNSSNRWEKTTISDNIYLSEYLVNDSGIVLKDCVIENNQVSNGPVFKNIDVTVDGSETIFRNNKSSGLVFDIRVLQINSGKVSFKGNEGDKENQNPNDENSGVLRLNVGLYIEREAKLLIEENRSKRSIFSIDNANAQGANFYMGENSLLKVYNNTIDVVGVSEYNSAMRFNSINDTVVRGAIEVIDNKFTGAGVGLRVIRGKFRVGSTHMKVKGNECMVDGETVVEVLSDVNTGFIEMVDTSSKFDVENSEMQVAFKNQSGGYEGTIFIGFVDGAIKEVGETTKNDWYNVVFKADTVYHSYTLLSVRLGEEGTTGTSVRIVQVDPYKIIYKNGAARKNGGGVVEVIGSEYSQEVEAKLGIQVLKNNESFAADAFNFVGWSTIENVGYNEEKVSIFKANTSVPDLDYARTTESGEDVVYLYAVWKEYTYTINYEKVAAAAQGETKSQEVYYYDPVDIRVSGFVRTGYDVESWQVKSIKTKDGVNVSGNEIVVGNTIRPRAVLRELLKEDNGVITLDAVWVAVSSDGLHKHKDCGQYNGVDCIHDGVEKHTVNNTEYKAWSNSDATDISGSGYFYLSDSITRNNKVISVSGKLVICLNGKDLTGVRFQGSSGQVIITNCANYSSSFTAATTNNPLFTGVSGRIFAKIETEVKANRLVQGNSFKAINVKFSPISTNTVTSSIITISDGQGFGLSNVLFKDYKTNYNLMTISGAEDNKETGVYFLNIEGGRYQNVMTFDNTTMNLSLVKVSGVEVAGTVLSVVNSSDISIINDFEIERSSIAEGVINLTNLSISSTLKSRVNIHDNENLKYVVKVESGSSWYADTDSELNMNKNTLRSINGEQGVLLLNGTLEVAGELNVTANVTLLGSGLKAGLLVGEKGLIRVKSALIKIDGNTGLDMHQVYSKNTEGFIEAVSGYKFKPAMSKMTIAFPEPYIGVVFKYYNAARVEGINSVSVSDVFVAETGVGRENVKTAIATRDGVQCVVLNLSLANLIYSVRYKGGMPTDSQGLTYDAGNDIVENNKRGDSITLKDKNAFSMTGFKLTRWIAERTGKSYEPNAIVSVEDLGILGEGDELVLVAQWDETKYNIQYTVAESTATLVQRNPIQAYYYRTTYLSETAATRTNYVLSGWEVTEVRNNLGTAISNSLVGTTFEKNSSVSKLLEIDDGTVVLKALWEARQILFKFNIQGARASNGINKSPSLSNVATKNVGIGQQIKFTSDGAMMEGFTLVGYKDEGKNRTFDLNTNYTVATNMFTIVNNEVSLVSVWEENKYTLKLTKNTSDTAITGNQVIKELKYYEQYDITQSVFRKNGYRIRQWKVNSILDGRSEEVDIDTANSNGLIKNTTYVMPAEDTKYLSVSELLNIKSGVIELMAVLENTHKHYRYGAKDEIPGLIGMGTKVPYEPLRQKDIDDGILRTAFYDETGARLKTGVFFLTENVQFKYDMPINGSVYICLNGYELDANGYAFIKSGDTFGVSICSCIPARNSDAEGYVTVYDNPEASRNTPIFEGFTTMQIYAYELDGTLGHVKVAVAPFGDGSSYDTSLNVETTYGQEFEAKRRGAKKGSVEESVEIVGANLWEPMAKKGSAEESVENKNSYGSSNNSNSVSYSSSGSKVNSASGGSNGNAVRRSSGGGGNSSVGSVSGSKLKENIENTKNILDMLYAININNILTDTKVYDSGDFVESMGKFQYIINNEKLKSGIYKIKKDNKVNIYKIDDNGNIETGIKMINNEMYFFKETGEMAINEKIIHGNVEYEIDELGVIKSCRGEQIM